MNFIPLGPVPADEPCAQVGQADYREKALEECRRYKAQLEVQFPDATFGIRSFPHDFGTYFEVVVAITARDDFLAHRVEAEAWTTWQACTTVEETAK